MSQSNTDYNNLYDKLLPMLETFSEEFNKENAEDIQTLVNIVQLLNQNSETDERILEPINSILIDLGLDTLHPTKTQIDAQSINITPKVCQEPLRNKNSNTIQIDETYHSITVPQARDQFAEAWQLPEEHKNIVWNDIKKLHYLVGSDTYNPYACNWSKEFGTVDYNKMDSDTKKVFPYRLLCPTSREHNFMIHEDQY